MDNQQLIPVFKGEISGEPAKLVNARDLHQFLDVRRDFSTWIRGRIEEYGFVEGEDFAPQNGGANLEKPNNGSGGHNRVEYHLSLDMAKELSMVERNDKGRMARRYFIECEKELRNAIETGQYRPESDFIREAFKTNKDGYLKPYIREFEAALRFMTLSGFSKKYARDSAIQFVDNNLGLNLDREFNINSEDLFPPEEKEQEYAKLSSQHQSPDIDSFWATCYQLTNLLECKLNHSNTPNTIAINIKELVQACADNKVPIPTVLKHKNDLRSSISPAFVESSKTVSSRITDRSIRCWIFSLS